MVMHVATTTGTARCQILATSWVTITYYCTARGDNTYDVAKGPPGPCGECGDSHWIWECEN